VLAVKLGTEGSKKVLGVGAASLEENSLAVCQLECDDGLTILEGLIVQLCPKEVIIPESSEYQKIAKVCW